MENNIPELTPEERQAALDKALVARRKRAQVRDDLKSGKITLAELIETQDEVVKRMRVSAMLEALPAIGETKTKRIMEECGIAESRRIGGLGKHQKAKLLARLAK
ncbi:MAG: integration host factor, actinobacterial type [Coriobacteriia bacterium]|nr:integration host factor, actinobacterial type [Coriobacteriia bacterium]